MTAAPDLIFVLIERDVREGQHWVIRDRPGAAQDGADPRAQLIEMERLGDVVVPAHGETRDLVLAGVLRGQEDHRDVVQVPAQPLNDLESVEVRQHDIENEQVERAGAGEAEGLRSGAHGRHCEPQGTQQGGNGIPEELLVVHHEQVARVVSHYPTRSLRAERLI
jgi:hypothetical protein